MLGKVLVALEAVLVGVKNGQTFVRQHLGLFQLVKQHKKMGLINFYCLIPELEERRFGSLTASSGSPWKNLRSGSSRYCRQSRHFGGVVCGKVISGVISGFLRKSDGFTPSEPTPSCVWFWEVEAAGNGVVFS